jgi:hypothetical protein
MATAPAPRLTRAPLFLVLAGVLGYEASLLLVWYATSLPCAAALGSGSCPVAHPFSASVEMALLAIGVIGAVALSRRFELAVLAIGGFGVLATLLLVVFVELPSGYQYTSSTVVWIVFGLTATGTGLTGGFWRAWTLARAPPDRSGPRCPSRRRGDAAAR